MTGRVVIAALIAALAASGAAWVGWARETPSDKSVERIVDKKLAEHQLNDPYRADAKLIKFQLEQLTGEMKEVKGGQDELKRDVGEIMGVLKALSKQLDGLSDQLSRDNDG